MKRIEVRRPGGPEALIVLEEPDPIPPAGKVRVRVSAAGVNYADVIVREGHYEAAKGLYPITPGFEFAGTVDAVGDGVSVFKEGDRMFGFTRFGGRTFLPRLAWNWLRVPRFSPLELTGTNRSVMGFNVVHLTEKAELAREGFDAIAGWAREGKLKKPPVTSFPAERAADAHQALESGETVGKLVLTF